MKPAASRGEAASLKTRAWRRTSCWALGAIAAAAATSRGAAWCLAGRKSGSSAASRALAGRPCRSLPEGVSQESDQTADWRAFRARLIQRSMQEDADTEEAVGSTAGLSAGVGSKPSKGWIHSTPLIERGSVLLSQPGPLFVEQPFFHKAVIIITEHDDRHGSLGFILNRPTSRQVLLGNGVDVNVWYGGPCQGLDEAYPEEQWACCLHSRPALAARMAQVTQEPVVPGLYMVDPHEAYNFIMTGQAEPDDFMYLVGHCGWGQDQLQMELDMGNCWRMVAADAEMVVGGLSRRQRALRRGAVGRGLPVWRRLMGLLPPQELPAAGNDEVLDAMADTSLRAWVDSWREEEAEEEDVAVEERSAREASFPINELLRQLLAMMAGSLANAFTQEQGCEAIRNLIVDADSCSTVVAQGGVRQVLESMRSHLDHAGVQGHCAGALTHLANSREAREQLLAEGGLQEVVDAMGRHLDSSLVQYKGCAVVANFCASDEEQRKALDAGAVAVTLKAMERHVSDAEVQDYCCGALYNIAKLADGRALISSSGGVQIVQRAVDVHPEAETVSSIGRRLLRLLWQDSAERSLPD